MREHAYRSRENKRVLLESLRGGVSGPALPVDSAAA